MTGQRFGRLLVAGLYHFGRWVCVCDCGRLVNVLGTRLRHGDIRSCGCLQREHWLALGSRRAITTLRPGHKFGRLTVLAAS